MTADRRTALLGGALYLATFVTSFPGLALKSAYLTGGADRPIAAAGIILEILLAAACVATAIVLYPVTRRVSPRLALAFVISRTVEAAMILVGVLALFGVASLRDAGAGGEAPLVALHDASFLIGPAFMSATNALLLGTVMHRGRLVPRLIPLIGLIGAPVLLASSVGVLFGLWTQTSPIGAAGALLIAIWEFSLGVWLVLRGFTREIPAPEEAMAAQYD